MSDDNNNKTEVELSEYQIMDLEDEKQIKMADTALQQELVYETKNGKKALSITGIKWLVLKMSQKGQPLKVTNYKVELMKHHPEDQEQWTWYADVMIQNLETKLEIPGFSNSSFLDGAYPDTFGRTKALSKATRNAQRHHIPEAEIHLMLNNVDPANIKKVDTSYASNGHNNNNNTSKPPSEGTTEISKGLKMDMASTNQHEGCRRFNFCTQRQRCRCSQGRQKMGPTC